MKIRSTIGKSPPQLAVAALTFLFTLVIRVWGISRHFLLMEDQIRDWTIALRPLTDLPLVGSPTHVHGYTIGPAFYWILWVVRVVIGPWFENLPHAGGIGQALLQSACDVLLVTAVWKRTESVWLSLAAVALLATAPFDVSLGATIWNPVMGSILAKAATALILLDWPRRSVGRAAIVAAIAWSAVHAYTGAIFVALGVFVALVADAAVRGERRTMWQRALVIVGVVAALQIPYAINQVSNRFSDSGMRAVTSSLERVFAGSQRPHVLKSAAFYVQSVESIEGRPWRVAGLGWILLGCGAMLAVHHRRDPALLSITLLPQLAAVLGYALWIDDLDSYYYLSLMPAAVLTILLGSTALLSARSVRVIGYILFVGVVAMVPARLQIAATLHRMPQYGALVAGSREIARLKQPVRQIRTEFALPPTSDPEFVFGILGGRIERRAAWWAVIRHDGQVAYHYIAPN